MARSAGCALGLALLAGCVCPPLEMRPLPPQDAREALRRINDNIDRVEGALYCSALTSFRFRDEGGRDRRFIGHEATLIFERPRCLYFDIKSALAGSVARIGSNDERYWSWVDVPDMRKLYWGTWAALEAGRARPLAVPPDRLLDALMFRRLPEYLPDGYAPLLIEVGDARHLLFPMVDELNWPYIRRELVLHESTYWLPREIIDRLPDGRIAMHARLSNYRRVADTGPGGPLTPRRYVVTWNQSEAEMALELLRVKYRTNQLPFCEFPEAWDGVVEVLDEADGSDLWLQTPGAAVQ